MIIFGTRGVKSTLAQGNFVCPQCATSEAYKHKKVTKFFTLYFIPVIPLGRMGEYVECQRCRGTFVTRVLEYDPDSARNEFQSIYEKAMRHTMAMIVLADGEIDDNELKVVLEIINKFGHKDMTMGELVAYIFEVQRNPENIDTYLRKVTPSLNEHGKEMIIKCAIAVAAADGQVDQSEILSIKEMATAMEMSAMHLKGILSEMTEKQTSFSTN
ncbi:MAG: TerB family tellurite resistance protein [Saprospiraceae bacterium]|nr:TerB family tellurite resistance protein [Saprospiraceae bacterium]